MKRWWVLVVVAGCAASPKPQPAPLAAAAPPENVLGKLESFRAEMCACHAGDQACGSKVQRALGDFNDAHRESRVPYHEVKRIELVAGEIDRCEKRALSEDVMAVMERFRDAMCACTAGDRDCAMRVQKDMQDYAESRNDLRDMKMTDEDMKRATDIGMAMAKCSATAMGPNNTP
ncbi:MAG: hypothetical protein ACM31C_16035 [Acidobacteriota bacterium]